MAEVTEEEYWEQQRRVEDKNAQQQNLIRKLEKDKEKLERDVQSLRSIQQQRIHEEAEKKQRLKALLEK